MNSPPQKSYRAVVLGASMGGVEALKVLLGALPRNFSLPILIAHHISPDAESQLAGLLGAHTAIRVKEADDGEPLAAGTAYLAPANYHLLVERNERLALSVDPLVNFARPSVDVLFETAAGVFGPALIGIILTGAGSDGSQGLKTIKARGGLAIVQSPADAMTDAMPRSALAATKADHVLPLKDIPRLLCALAGENRAPVATPATTKEAQR